MLSKMFPVMHVFVQEVQTSESNSAMHRHDVTRAPPFQNHTGAATAKKFKS